MASGRNKAGAPVPGQVAEKLKGKSFPTFKAFQEAFWNAVAETPELAEQFTAYNQKRMRGGNAPFAPRSEAGGRRGVWALHHAPDIGKGGPVYDLSTIKVVTPAQHEFIHYGNRSK